MNNIYIRKKINIFYLLFEIIINSTLWNMQLNNYRIKFSKGFLLYSAKNAFGKDKFNGSHLLSLNDMLCRNLTLTKTKWTPRKFSFTSFTTPPVFSSKTLKTRQISSDFVITINLRLNVTNVLSSHFSLYYFLLFFFYFFCFYLILWCFC